MKLTDSRVFLLRLSDRTAPAFGVPIGHIEHVESGLRARFSSMEEMRDFIASVLAEEAALVLIQGAPGPAKSSLPARFTSMRSGRRREARIVDSRRHQEPEPRRRRTTRWKTSSCPSPTSGGFAPTGNRVGLLRRRYTRRKPRLSRRSTSRCRNVRRIPTLTKLIDQFRTLAFGRLALDQEL